MVMPGSGGEGSPVLLVGCVDGGLDGGLLEEEGDDGVVVLGDGLVEGRVLAGGDSGIGTCGEEELNDGEVSVRACARERAVSRSWVTVSMVALLAGSERRKIAMSRWSKSTACISGVHPRASKTAGLAPAATSACTTESGPFQQA
jgi:hypothetical protein